METAKRAAKYPQNTRTKREFISKIKSAEQNETFFNRDANRFFGRQTFDVSDDGATFYIQFPEKRPGHTASYSVDPESLKLRPIPRS